MVHHRVPDLGPGRLDLLGGIALGVEPGVAAPDPDGRGRRQDDQHQQADRGDDQRPDPVEAGAGGAVGRLLARRRRRRLGAGRVGGTRQIARGVGRGSRSGCPGSGSSTTGPCRSRWTGWARSAPSRSRRSTAPARRACRGSTPRRCRRAAHPGRKPTATRDGILSTRAMAAIAAGELLAVAPPVLDQEVLQRPEAAAGQRLGAVRELATRAGRPGSWRPAGSGCPHRRSPVGQGEDRLREVRGKHVGDAVVRRASRPRRWRDPPVGSDVDALHRVRQVPDRVGAATTGTGQHDQRVGVVRPLARGLEAARGVRERQVLRAEVEHPDGASRRSSGSPLRPGMAGRVPPLASCIGTLRQPAALSSGSEAIRR